MGAGLRVVKEHAWKAHDALHKGDTDTAHGELHRALGLPQDDLPTSTAATPSRMLTEFDHAFIELCRRHGARAVYVLQAGDMAYTGGDAQMCAELDRRLRAST